MVWTDFGLGQAMTTAMKGFDCSRVSAMTPPMLLMNLAVCSVIVPCLVVIGLSRKLSNDHLNCQRLALVVQV